MRLRAVFAVLALLLAPALSAASVQSFTIRDATYGGQRRVWLYDPPGAVNLFIFLGGDYVDELAAPAAIESLVNAKKIAPAAAVFIDTSDLRPADMANRAKFDQMITGSVVPWIRGKIGHLPTANRVTVVGASVGGLIATYLAFRHPDLFGNVLSQSGAFWRGNEGASEPEEWLTEQFRARERLPIRFYLEVGSKETVRTPSGVVFIEANRDLRDVLVSKKYDVRYVEVPDAVHNPAHWKKALPDGIEHLSVKSR